MNEKKLPIFPLFSFFLITALILGSAGCARSSPSASTPTPARSDTGSEKVVITFAAYEYQRRLYESLMEEFNAENPDILVQFVDMNSMFTEEQDWNQQSYFRKIAQAADTAMFQGGGNEDLSRYFRDLRPLYEADPTFQPGDFWPGMLSACEDPYGNMIGLPLNATLMGVFYDPAAFDAARLPHPAPGWTYDDFQKAVSTLANKKGSDIQYGFYDQPYLFGSILGPVVNAHLEAHDGEADGEALLKEIQWYVDLVKAGALSGVKDQEEMMNDWEVRTKLFENEATRPIMWIDSLVSYLPSSSYIMQGNDPFAGTTLEKYSFAPMPVSADGSFTNTNMSWVECATISAGSAHPRAAWAWLNFLSKQWLVMDKSQAYELSRVPSRQSVADANGYWDLLPAKVIDSVRYALGHGAYLSTYNETFHEVNTALAMSIAGTADFSEYLAQAAANRPVPPTQAVDNSPIVVATPIPPLAEGITVVKYFVSIYGQQELTAIKTLAEQYNQRLGDKQIRVLTEFYSSPDDDWFASMANEFDCFMTNAPYWEYMSPTNLLNLNSLMSSEPASFTNDFAPPMMDKFRYEGDLYGLPLTSQVQMMAYNADLLARRGLSVPKNDWTFDEFVELASAAASTNSSDLSYGYLFSTYDEFFFLGREVRWADLQANPAKVYFDSPEMLAHLRWIASLKDNGTLFLQDDNWQEMEKLMTGGQLAFWSAMMGEKNSYFYMPGQESPYKIGMVPLPAVEGENPMSGWSNDRGQYISAQSNEAQACWDWIKFLSDKPDLFSGVPARRSVAESPAWEASVGREEAAAYRAAIAQAKPPEQVDVQAQQPLWPLYNWRGEAVDAAFKGLDLPPLLQVLQQKAENYLACSLTIDTSMPSEELHQSILDCAKQADPEGKWWR